MSDHRSNCRSLAIGSDHRGYALKEELKQCLRVGDISIAWHDVGAYSDERTDYPYAAHAVVQKMQEQGVVGGVLLCGMGHGMAIAANRVPGIYAAVAWDVASARSARADDHGNILVVPADICNRQQAYMILEAWLTTQEKGGRYADRLKLLDTIMKDLIP